MSRIFSGLENLNMAEKGISCLNLTRNYLFINLIDLSGKEIEGYKLDISGSLQGSFFIAGFLLFPLFLLSLHLVST